MKNRYTILIGLFLMLAFSASSQNEWPVPDEFAQLKNPVEASAANIEVGKKLYMTQCKSCHGDPGKDNGLPLVPKPVDPGSADFHKQSDGEIFYRFTEGRGAMPQFKALINENDRWKIVRYLRTLNPDKKAAASAAASVIEEPTNFDGLSDFQIALDYKPAEVSVLANVSAMKEGKRIPVQGIDVQFFVKRYFGNLPFADGATKTNAEGQAIAVFPNDLPGDSTGNVAVLVALADEDRFGRVIAEDQIDWGVPTIPVNLLDHRSLWTVSRMAPIWLIASFLGSVMIVWGFIFYIIFQVIRLPKFAEEAEV